MAGSKKRWIGIILLGFVGLIALVQLILWLRSDTKSYGPKTYIIARDVTWFPLDFLGKSRQVAAFSDELLNAIASEEKINVRIYSTASHQLFPGLHARHFQGVIVSEVPQGTLFENYVSSLPYFRFGSVLVVRKESQTTELNQLKGTAVGVLRGANLQFDHASSDITYIPYDNVLTALQHLSDGAVEGVIIDAFPAFAYTNSLFADRLRVASTPLSSQALRLIALKGPEGRALIRAFDHGLEVARNNGTYAALLKKWGLMNTEVLSPVMSLPDQ